jgi:hypothetical protein
MVALYLGNFLIGGPISVISVAFDLDGEGSISAWFSSIQLFVVSALFGLLLYRKAHRIDQRAFFLGSLTAAFLVLSLDEYIQIHEHLGILTDALLPGGDRENTAFRNTGIWMFVIGVPAGAVLVWLAFSVRDYFRAAPTSLAWFFCGMAVWLGGALGLEAIGNLFERGSLAYALEVSGEEWMEMAGVSMMVWSLLLVLRADGLSLVGKSSHRQENGSRLRPGD